MENLSDLQLLEISRLLDERYVTLKLRLRILKPLYEKNPSMYREVIDELALIDSINEFL